MAVRRGSEPWRTPAGVAMIVAGTSFTTLLFRVKTDPLLDATLGPSLDVLSLVALTAAEAVLGALVAVDSGLSLRGQLGFAPRWAASAAGRWQAAAVTLIASAAMCGSAYLYLRLQTVSWLPKMNGTQPEVLGLTNPVDYLVHAIVGSAGEELIVTAAVVALLAAARRPAWQMYAMAVALRMALYAYSGTLAIAAVLFTAVNIWLYTRTRRIVPIIAAHLAYNLTTCFDTPTWSTAEYRIGAAAAPAFAIGFTWLLLRRRGTRSTKRAAGSSA